VRLAALALVTGLVGCQNGEATEQAPTPKPATTLPSPTGAAVTLDQALRQRRSIRDYADRPLTTAQLSSLLWAAQGITGQAQHYRTAPSAGALHPLELYVVAGQVEGLEPGVYHYRVADGALELVTDGDRRRQLCEVALGQDCICSAPASVVIAADYERTTTKYRHRGRRYVHIDAGFAAQNLHLQATALGLGTVAVGAFDDLRVQAVLGIPWDPLLIMPIGWPLHG
jgi:SagB-type dehydrogenase family enzyme